MKISNRFRKEDRKRLWATYAEGGCSKKGMSFEWWLKNCTFGYIFGASTKGVVAGPADRVKALMAIIQTL